MKRLLWPEGSRAELGPEAGPEGREKPRGAGRAVNKTDIEVLAGTGREQSPVPGWGAGNGAAALATGWQSRKVTVSLGSSLLGVAARVQTCTCMLRAVRVDRGGR